MNILHKLGLTDSEIKVFLELSKLGSVPASRLIGTGIYRTNVYDILKKLADKGLVTTITKDHVRHFSVTNPKNLYNLLEEQRNELNNAESEIAELIKSIKPVDFSQRSEISLFQEKQGLQYFYEELADIARSKDEVLIIGSTQTILNVFNYYMLNLTKKIKEINVFGRMIANKRIIKSAVMKRILKLANLNLRFLPEGYISPVAVFIFKNNLGFCNFTENPFVIMVNDPVICKAYRQHFNSLWKKSTS